ncbi:GNAT family N-acetyltransferase [Bacillus sp. FJAT-49711]|uniref:GNAT family N-acetyltransferase n=1 Tax=Bacillus sp. FJAT-49711 TaxID=2833585 RepID=UPI001BC8FCD5|nr:GNAT family N-acetyltransferase [Bacillus sp. FJAT-49711]MBS4218088.1 GNAT family N-acetyltransferase [Bacillus sp. FJAT-49711]
MIISRSKIKIIRLSIDSINEASFLLAHYIHPYQWAEKKQEECLHNLKQLLQFKNADFLVALNGDAPAGFIALNWGFSTTKGKPILLIQDLFVMPSFRRNGIAKMLIDESVLLAKERDANRLQLNTSTSNNNARSLYQSKGFEWFPDKEIYMLFI